MYFVLSNHSEYIFAKIKQQNISIRLRISSTIILIETQIISYITISYSI